MLNVKLKLETNTFLIQCFFDRIKSCALLCHDITEIQIYPHSVFFVFDLMSSHPSWHTFLLLETVKTHNEGSGRWPMSWFGEKYAVCSLKVVKQFSACYLNQDGHHKSNSILPVFTVHVVCLHLILKPMSGHSKAMGCPMPSR